mgnify:CR=1 FL=1
MNLLFAINGGYIPTFLNCMRSVLLHGGASHYEVFILHSDLTDGDEADIRGHRKTYIGSTHDVPHSPQHLSNNNFNGHLCVHFPISMEKAQSIGPYATSHQEAINEGWAATQKLKY